MAETVKLVNTKTSRTKVTGADSAERFLSSGWVIEGQEVPEPEPDAEAKPQRRRRRDPESAEAAQNEGES